MGGSQDSLLGSAPSTAWGRPQPEVDYIMGTSGLSIIPRRDGVLLGQTWERGEASLEPSPSEMQRVMTGLTQFFAEMT